MLFLHTTRAFRLLAGSLLFKTQLAHEQNTTSDLAFLLNTLAPEKKDALSQRFQLVVHLPDAHTLRPCIT